MKLACYTCITGNYDQLSTIPRGQSPDVDFICFTDDPQLEYSSGNWTIRPIPAELAGLAKVKQQRVVKACPHRYLGGYDASLWIDGNVAPLCDIMKFVGGYDLGKTAIFTRKHPSRDCIYREVDAVLKARRDTKENVAPQIERYRKEGFPSNFGLHETNIVLRSHLDRNAALLCNMWAKEILDGSHRDQLSFDYCRWKLGVEVGELKAGNMLKGNLFRWRRHGR